MKRIQLLALAASISALAMSSSASAATHVDGILSSGEYSNAIVTNTPLNPLSDVTLATFSNGNENVAETTFLQNDPNGLGFDFAVRTDPAGAGQDNADASLGEQFTNVYFGNPVDGAVVVFELGNNRAFNLANGNVYDYQASLGIQYADVSGTSYANGGLGSVSEAYIPYAAYDTVLTNLGLTAPAAGDVIQVRDLQAFSYGGNNAGGGERFGSVTVAAISAAPEPAEWALMLGGVGLAGLALRRRKGLAVAGFAA